MTPNSIHTARISAWYRAGGAPAPIAAYQPKGAASLAASYINLANPGTNNAAAGVAPTWDAANGWIFNGTSQYLTTGVTNIPNNQTWSLLCRFVQGSGGSGYYGLCGCVPTGTGGFGFSSGSGRTSVARACSGGVVLFTNFATLTSGVVGIAGGYCFRDGTKGNAILTGGASPFPDAFSIAGVSGAYYYPGTIQAIALYNATLTDAQMLAVSAAMALL